MQGSKYVQSSLGNIFKDVQKKLKNDIFVLFSGTPCQVDALKSYLRKDYPNLLTVDIICHGVPSEQFLMITSTTQRKKLVEKSVNLNFGINLRVGDTI